MVYKPIEIDRTNLTIMGVHFPDLETLDSTAGAIGSNMFEGFEPTKKSVEIIRDYVMDKVTTIELAQMAKNKAYV
ncbi:MAG: antitoxin VbhA family protein [Synergistaceae bacterium]|nr:antitoxin VbhA family protein [Synergistaceae bacterium]